MSNAIVNETLDIFNKTILNMLCNFFSIKPYCIMTNRGILSTLSNIYDEAFYAKIVNG